MPRPRPHHNPALSPVNLPAAATTLQQRIAKAMAHASRIVERPVTQSELARATGLDQSSVNNWCTGKSTAMKSQTAARVAFALRVNPVWLATGIGHMVDPPAKAAEPPPTKPSPTPHPKPSPSARQPEPVATPRSAQRPSVTDLTAARLRRPRTTATKCQAIAHDIERIAAALTPDRRRMFFAAIEAANQVFDQP